MKKIPIFVLLVLFVCPSSWAQSIEDRRRVEEEKRKDLSASEFYLPEAERLSLSGTPSGQDIFFNELLAKETADLADACKTLVILMGMDDRLDDADARMNFLKEEGILPESILNSVQRNPFLRKGTAAYMFVKMMGIKGGVTMRVFGLSERYAFKELVYEGMMSPGNVGDVMSGPELIMTLTRAAEYMTQRQGIKPLNKEKGP